MAFMGLIPSEHSSGASRHQGSATKRSDRRVRRVLVESAWAYRHAPALHGTYRKIAAHTGAHTAVVATARELSGFIWGLTTGNLGPAR